MHAAPQGSALTEASSRIETPATRFRRGSGGAMWPVALALAVTGVLFLWPIVANVCSSIPADDGFIRPGQSDAFNFLWGHWWMQRAVRMGADPFFSTWVFPPRGVDLVFHTHTFLPSVLTIPLSLLLGTVASYNLMLVGMLFGAALAVAWFLHRELELSRAAAYGGGVAFGYCAYFVFKAHAHPNLINGVIWGGCLALLVGSYVRSRFTLWRALGFGALYWATFWTSFVEFFMLTVVVAATVVMFELEKRLRDARRKCLFVVAIALGTPSLLLFRHGQTTAVGTDLIGGLTWKMLVQRPITGWSGGGSYTTGIFEYWGISVPFAVRGSRPSVSSLRCAFTGTFELWWSWPHSRCF